MSAVIEFSNVSKRFFLHHDRSLSFPQRVARLVRGQKLNDDTSFWALQNVSFTLQRGEAIGLIGHNGSGKSTTLKLITRILEPTSGKIVVNGRISALLELGSGFHPDLTGRENIYLNGSLLGLSHALMRRKMDDIIDFSELDDFIDTPVRQYSSGMYMRLAFAIAISIEPDILITDEVLAVGDDAFQRKCLDRIFRFKQQGCTILFVSHALHVVQSLCDRVLWFDHGVLRYDGSPIVGIDAYLKVANEHYRGQLVEERRRAKERLAADPDDPHDTEVVVAREDQADTAVGEVQPVEDPGRWGTREIEIVEVELLDRTGLKQDVFETGDTVVLRMHYVAHTRIEQPVFGAAIYHRNGLHINGPNTRFSNFPIAALEGPGVLEYVVESLPLLDGDYLFTVAVYDHTMSHPYDHHDRKYPFRVLASTVQERFGLVYIPGVWRWGECAPVGGNLNRPADSWPNHE